jgi:hypothetical protein
MFLLFATPATKLDNSELTILTNTPIVNVVK